MAPASSKASSLFVQALRKRTSAAVLESISIFGRGLVVALSPFSLCHFLLAVTGMVHRLFESHVVLHTLQVRSSFIHITSALHTGHVMRQLLYAARSLVVAEHMVHTTACTGARSGDVVLQHS